LTTDIIRIIADDTELSVRIDDTEVELEEVALDEVQLGVPLLEVRHTLPIDLDSGSLQIRVLEEILGEHTHTRSDL
jgi:hypothetical protein